MRKLSLFSGIGGIDLAAHWAGMETVAFCEREPFPQKVIRKHWPGVPIYDDVKNLNREVLEHDGIIGPGRSIDIVSAGYPCQPFSVAGDRKGEEDDRHLWPEVKRLIQEIRPSWFVGENVVGHVTLGLDEVLTDLDNIGYSSQSFIIPACAVNADHERERVFVVANAECSGRTGILCPELTTSKESYPHWATNALDAHRHPVPRIEQSLGEPSIFGGNDGIPDRMDRSLISPRLKALGNSVNPYQIYPILASIKQIDDMMHKDEGHRYDRIT